MAFCKHGGILYMVLKVWLWKWGDSCELLKCFILRRVDIDFKIDDFT